MRIRGFIIALTLVGLFFSNAATAQDGTLRSRLRERMAERHGPPSTPAPAGPIGEPGDHAFSIEHQGLVRLARVHVPATYRAGAPAALLVALHGGGGNMDLQANDSYYGLVAKAEREGFVVLFPNGYTRLSSGKLATWNAGHCCGAARDRDVDDVGFIRAAVGELVRHLDIDRQRIFATGMSNGAMMAYRLACEASDLFTAIAAVAGTDNTRSCTPSRPVAVLHIHARDDTHVLFNGGAGPDSMPARFVTHYQSVAATVDKWKRIDGCAAPMSRTLERPGAYCETTAPCQGGARVQLCVTDTGGHSWPGGNKPRAGPSPSSALSANDVMWDFFMRR